VSQAVEGAETADPTLSPPAWEPTSVVPAPPPVAPPARVVSDKPKPAAERPKPPAVEKPKPPVEKPRPVVESPIPAAAPPAKPIDPPAVAPVDAGPAKAAGGGYSLGCLALAFAMLVIGFAAGFLWRHQTSRRKLGGMSVRIGTWRGIP
jgi:hypothetical protein